MQIKRLASDFDDGIKLVVLVESLSGKSLGKYNKVPKRLPQCLENVGMVLQFLQGDEGLRLVNIGRVNLACSYFAMVDYQMMRCIFPKYDESKINVPFPEQDSQMLVSTSGEC